MKIFGFEWFKEYPVISEIKDKGFNVKRITTYLYHITDPTSTNGHERNGEEPMCLLYVDKESVSHDVRHGTKRESQLKEILEKYPLAVTKELH